MSVSNDTRQPWRLRIDMTACSPTDLEAKLRDLCHELEFGKVSPRSVFASPSCSGIVEFAQQTGGIGCGLPSQYADDVPCGRQVVGDGETFTAVCARCAGLLLDGVSDG